VRRYLRRAVQRRGLGQAHLGHLLGVGCAASPPCWCCCFSIWVWWRCVRHFPVGKPPGRACAVLALVGTVNIPIIYKSVDWWYSLHQPATIRLTSAPSMHPDMFKPLLVMIVGLYVFYALALILNTRAEILARERRSGWVLDLVAGRQQG